MRTLVAASFSLLVCALAAHALDETKLVDLTYSFSEDTHHWPTAKPFHLEKVAEGRTPAPVDAVKLVLLRAVNDRKQIAANSV